MGKMQKTSKGYCAKCYFCHEPNTFHCTCEYYLKTKQRRNCPIGYCDKFVGRTEGKKKFRLSFGKGKGFNQQ